MKILIFGREGQLGKALSNLYPQATAIGRDECDLSDLNALEDYLAISAPDLIINAAAYTAVDLAESNIDDAYGVNCIAPQAMASYAASHQIPFVHYSTNYVFDGESAAPYKEADMPHPLNIYGQSKLDGELAVIATCESVGSPYWILRTSWVYGSVDGDGGNFIKTILDVARQYGELSVVSDQLGTPTSAAWLAEVTQLILSKIKKVPPGIYHVVPRGQTSRYGLACWVIELAKHLSMLKDMKNCSIRAIASDTYPSSLRPKNGCLDHRHLLEVLEMSAFPHWQEQVTTYVESLAPIYKQDNHS